MTHHRRSQLLRLLRRLRQQETSGQRQRLIYRINARLFLHLVDSRNWKPVTTVRLVRVRVRLTECSRA